MVKELKLQIFIETYHTPYTPRQRYWTGMLLLVRIVLYLVAAVNVTNSPQIALTSVSVSVTFLFFLKSSSGRVYKMWPLDVLESFFYLNIVSLSVFTWYSLGEASANKEAAAYVSVTMALLIVPLIILYHLYSHTSMVKKLHKTKLGLCIGSFLLRHNKTVTNSERPSPDDDRQRFIETLDMVDRPVNASGYVPSLKSGLAAPTSSVVELRKPLLQPRQQEDSPQTVEQEI